MWLESENGWIIIIVLLVWESVCVWYAVWRLFIVTYHRHVTNALKQNNLGLKFPRSSVCFCVPFLLNFTFFELLYVTFGVLLMGRCNKADDGFCYSWFGLQRKGLNLKQVPRITVVLILHNLSCNKAYNSIGCKEAETKLQKNSDPSSLN